MNLFLKDLTTNGTIVLSLGGAIALLTACQSTVIPAEKVQHSPQDQRAINRYLATKMIQPSFGGKVFCEHEILGARSQSVNPSSPGEQTVYLHMFCSEYYRKDDYVPMGTATAGPVALTTQRQQGALQVVSHQTADKVTGVTAKELFPKEIFSKLNQAAQNNPSLNKKAERQAQTYFTAEPYYAQLVGAWEGPSDSPLAAKDTRAIRRFTTQGTTHTILKTGWDFLAVPTLSSYTINTTGELPAIDLDHPTDSRGSIGVFTFLGDDNKPFKPKLSTKPLSNQLLLNLVTEPDSRPKDFVAKTAGPFFRQTDQQVMILANIEGAVAEILSRSIQQIMATYIEQGRFNTTSFLPPTSLASTNYQIQAKILDPKRVQITAIASPKANLPSFTAGVILADLSIGVPGGKKSPMLVGGICRTSQPSSTAPDMPTLRENQELVTCPPGSERLAIAPQ